MQRLHTLMTAFALVGMLGAPAAFAQLREQLPVYTPQAPLAKATTFIGKAVVNGKGESLGRIVELMIDPVSGNITYAALSHGSIFGMGGKLFAISWKALALQRQPDGTVFFLNLDKEVLYRVPGFDKHNWPQQPDPLLSALTRLPETRARPATGPTPGPGVAATVPTVQVPAAPLPRRTEQGNSGELQAPSALRIVPLGNGVESKRPGTAAPESSKKP